ncbi:MAG: ACP S-malonyltransferase [Candidatus Latescibacterota bacterium]|nr:ACP S-malonyltransferase [Candidatus Latescibacterota bacterium]
MSLALLFPGQASQAVGMAVDLYEADAEVKDLFDVADECLGISLTKLCFEGPMEELSQTSVTQPAVYVHSVAATRVLTRKGIDPVATAGHSLGEYSALTAAGVFEFADGLRLVGERGRLMQEAGTQRPGKMAAIIGLDDDDVVKACEIDVEGNVVPANFNAPGQVVISGDGPAVEVACKNAEKADAAKVVVLPVSGAFHSPLMQPAADAMKALLYEVEFCAPTIPVVTNVTGSAVTDPEELRRCLIQQITAPVRWADSIRSLAGAGVDIAAEVGPGSVLRGLVRRIQRGIKVLPAGTVEDIEETGSKLSRL